MLTDMDTLDSVSLSRASPAKGGEVEHIESLPTPVPAEQGPTTSTFLLASLPSRLGALWTSAEPGACAFIKRSKPQDFALSTEQWKDSRPVMLLASHQSCPACHGC